MARTRASHVRGTAMLHTRKRNRDDDGDADVGEGLQVCTEVFFVERILDKRIDALTGVRLSRVVVCAPNTPCE